MFWPHLVLILVSINFRKIRIVTLQLLEMASPTFPPDPRRSPGSDRDSQTARPAEAPDPSLQLPNAQMCESDPHPDRQDHSNSKRRDGVRRELGHETPRAQHCGAGQSVRRSLGSKPGCECPVVPWGLQAATRGSPKVPRAVTRGSPGRSHRSRAPPGREQRRDLE